MTRNNKATFTAKEKAFANELAKYENNWVAISRQGGSEKIVGSGERITDAKREADSKGIKDPVFRKVPSSHAVLIPQLRSK